MSLGEFLSFGYVAAMLLAALLIPLSGVAWLAVGSRAALIWIGVYLAFILYFPNASWGVVDTDASRNFYTRGTGMFYFSAVNILLFGLAFQSVLGRGFGALSVAKHNLGKIALVFWLLFFGNIIVGVISGVRWFELIGYSGVLNVINFMLLFFVLMAAVQKSSDLDRFIDFFLFCAATRAVWGLVRFVAMGGDPANFYSNVQKIAIKLTFFDINDSLIATVAVFILAWRLVHGLHDGRWRKWLYIGLIALELFVIVFSYRRTAWGGLALAAILFAMTQERRIRYPLYLAYFGFGLPLLAYKMLKRSGDAGAGGSFLERMLPDIAQGGSINFESGRFVELAAAWDSIKESPLWGLGVWGRYSGFRYTELAWHRGDFGWMHSGVLHMMLKTGLIGVAVSSMIVLLVFHCAKKNWRFLPKNESGLLLAGAAGLLFMIPTWLLGTPVIEYRTMQLLALCCALPYIAIHVSKLKQE